jgi:hypothetical protein
MYLDEFVIALYKYDEGGKKKMGLEFKMNVRCFLTDI